MVSWRPLLTGSIWISVELLFLAPGLKNLQAQSPSHRFGRLDMTVQPPLILSSGCRVFCLPGAQALSSGVWEQGRRQAEKHSRGGLLTAGTLLFTCAWAVIHISEATQARKVPFVEVCNKDKYRIHLFLEVLICGMILSLLEVINLLCHTLYNFWRKRSRAEEPVVSELGLVCTEQSAGSLQN